MKAKINGIEVEGTPREIHELMVEMGPVKLKVTDLEPQKFVPFDPNWYTKAQNIFQTRASNNTRERQMNNCQAAKNGGCYCTGACM